MYVCIIMYIHEYVNAYTKDIYHTMTQEMHCLFILVLSVLASKQCEFDYSLHKL